MLREVIELADAAPGLSDQQLRGRALTLLIKLTQHARTGPE